MNSLSLKKSPPAIKLQTLLSLVASSVRPGRSCWREPADVAPASEHIFLTSVVPPLSSTRARGCFPAPSVIFLSHCNLWALVHLSPLRLPPLGQGGLHRTRVTQQGCVKLLAHGYRELTFSSERASQNCCAENRPGKFLFALCIFS